MVVVSFRQRERQISILRQPWKKSDSCGAFEAGNPSVPGAALLHNPAKRPRNNRGVSGQGALRANLPCSFSHASSSAASAVFTRVGKVRHETVSQAVERKRTERAAPARLALFAPDFDAAIVHASLRHDGLELAGQAVAPADFLRGQRRCERRLRVFAGEGSASKWGSRAGCIGHSTALPVSPRLWVMTLPGSWTFPRVIFTASPIPAPTQWKFSGRSPSSVTPALVSCGR